MRTYVLIWTLIASSVFLCAGCAGADEKPIPIRASAWTPVAFTEDGKFSDSLADFRVTEDPERGTILSIGDWTEGRWGARYDLRSPLDSWKGVVRGYYRTENIANNAASVWVRYYRGGDYVYDERTRLAPAAEWTPFELVFRRPPPGIDEARLAVGLGRHTEGTAYYASITISEGVPPLQFPEHPGPITRPAPPTSFQPGRYFRIEQADGAWSLVSPAGKAFYSVGTDGIWYREGDNPQAKDEHDAHWLRRLKANSLAGWTEISRWSRINDSLVAAGETPFATFLSLETGTWWGDFDHLWNAHGEPQSDRHAFPDPFDPAFEQAYRGRVREICTLVAGKPWYAAWFVDNEISHRDIYRYPYSEHCSLALRDFLQGKYDGIDALNDAWHTEYGSLDQIIEDKPDPAQSEGRMREDFEAFAREIVKKYVDVTLSIIRHEDPGRLVFSPRLMFGDSAYVDLYARYDAIAVNRYPSNNEPGLSQETVARLREIHERSGRPIIIGEWSVPALDSGLYDDPDLLDWSFPQTVPTQTDRARQAACVTIDFYNLPFVIGAHWFIWYDFDSPERRANRGLFTADGQPYVELIDALARAHEQIGAPVLADPYSAPSMAPTR